MKQVKFQKIYIRKKMKKYRCDNSECRQPILFEGEFVGVIRKICPKCKKMVVVVEKENLPEPQLLDV